MSSIAVLEKAEVVEEERSGNHLFVVISSDRGLCGSIHSNLARTIRPIMEDRSSSANTHFVCVGDKVCPSSSRLRPLTLLPHFAGSDNSTANLARQVAPDLQ